jgi:membrane protease YdiL (CAAX protease family)
MNDVVQRPRTAVLLFSGLVIGLGWLAALPLWLSGQGLAHPFAGLILIGLMWTPTAAALLTDLLLRRPLRGAVQRNGLGLGRRRWSSWLLAWTVPGAVMVAAPFVGALFGVYPLDLKLSGFTQMLAAGGVTLPDGIAPATVLTAQLVQALLLGPLLNAPAVFGEEYGWRGWLLPRLLPWGQRNALVLSGALWGVWHAPIILLGYNYPSAPQLGVVMMTGFCILSGVVLGWLRLRSGSVWPAVIAHGSINAFGGSVFAFAAADATIDTVLAGGLGLTGWLLWIALIGLLVGLRRLPVADVEDHAAAAA